ncbi:MAG: hypothetical protein HYU77_01635 [Betaproteobacteria bacterium]|nr:hypothetical protein [Betaproteobacteria bacterium]
MLEAGEDILECYRVLGKAGLNVVGEVLRGQGTFVEFDHYPSEDVFDHETHSQYYYHAHRGSAMEHGHFHTFLRAPGMSPGVTPEELPGSEEWPAADQALSHLVAISMDDYGFPRGLFAVNRWVTGDCWYRAEHVIAMLDRFAIDHAYPSWPVNRWITGMLRLFRPGIEALLLQRDAVVAAWQANHPGNDALEDRGLEITGWIPISVEHQIEQIRRALDLQTARGAAAANRGTARR